VQERDRDVVEVASVTLETREHVAGVPGDPRVQREPAGEDEQTGEQTAVPPARARLLGAGYRGIHAE
jgi:hypothetical protein